ncbi:MAG TPA: DsbA family oxidoreductase [Kineosporiaceae bacterium]
MRVEVWSDVVCPWCYIGKRRLESALAQFEHAGTVQVVWRSFQLHPDHPPGSRRPVNEYLAERFGIPLDQARAMNAQVTAIAAGEGLAYDTDRAWLVGTFDAHRLLHLGSALGVGTALTERLMRGQHVEGEQLDDLETLVRLAADAQVPADAARRTLASEEYADDVRADLRRAAAIGVSGVPFVLFDERLGVSGAQPVAAYLCALRRAHQDASTHFG